ncbi:MAG: nucleotidyltransferase domain-containing protein [Candidatus Paceibacterota bacterium]|jgi:predicted nucleotidyltransferase
MKTPLIIAFGSQVSGKSTTMSDHDFGVLGKQSLSLSERTDLSDYISKKLDINEDKIDIVDLRTASPLLKFEVARNGKLIDGEYFDFIRFKVLAFKEYVDTAKFRRLREEVMMKKYA